PYIANNAEPGGGVVSLWDATAESVNCAYIRLGVDVGLPKVIDVAHRMGIPAKVKLAASPSLSIGTYEVTPLQMASAYSTLAADGGVNVFGGTYPARIFHDFMSSTLSSVPVANFTGPDQSQIGPGRFLIAQDSPGALTSPLPPPPPPPPPGLPPPPALPPGLHP